MAETETKIINNIFVSQYMSSQHKFREVEKETFFYKKNSIVFKTNNNVL